MKIACSTTAFTQKPLSEALQNIADIGFKYVDLLMMENWAHINPSEIAKDPQKYSAEVGDLLRKNNLIAVGINGNVSHPLSSQVQAGIESNRKRASEMIFGK